MPAKRILILSGTGEARQLAAMLMNAGHDVTSSLAGVTENPILPEGKIRIGGFGGVNGLRNYLVTEKFDIVVDATHPFATIISRSAQKAASGLILLRLERASRKMQQGDNWIEVANVDAAVAALPTSAKVLLTIGRKEFATFMVRFDLSGVVRMIESPPTNLPPAWTLMRARPPFSVESELELFQAHNITHLVTKNAGGSEMESKLIAARRLKLPVIMITRPTKPRVPSFASAHAIVGHISMLGSKSASG